MQELIDDLAGELAKLFQQKTGLPAGIVEAAVGAGVDLVDAALSEDEGAKDEAQERIERIAADVVNTERGQDALDGFEE